MVTVIGPVALAAGLALSSACIVNVKLPNAVGVPLSNPLLDKLRPGGNEPDTTEKAYGAIPPVAVGVCEYATPSVALGSEVVTTARAGPMKMSNWLAADAPALSVT